MRRSLKTLLMMTNMWMCRMMGMILVSSIIRLMILPLLIVISRCGNRFRTVWWSVVAGLVTGRVTSMIGRCSCCRALLMALVLIMLVILVMSSVVTRGTYCRTDCTC